MQEKVWGKNNCMWSSLELLLRVVLSELLRCRKLLHSGVPHKLPKKFILYSHKKVFVYAIIFLSSYMHTGMTCCGLHGSSQVWMNTRSHTCCYNEQYVLEARKGQGFCCGLDKLFDPRSQMCCESGTKSHVHDVHHSQAVEQLDCCGLEIYNRTDEQCCRDGIVS